MAEILGFVRQRPRTHGVAIQTTTSNIRKFIYTDAGVFALATCGHAAVVTTPSENAVIVHADMDMDCTICSDGREP